MDNPTTITSLSAAPLTIPLFAPFGIASTTQDIARNVLVSVELADGTRGYGEAAPFSVYGESQEAALASVALARGTVEGADARAWRQLAAALAPHMGGKGAVQCAIETAVLDALTRHYGMPLWVFFGGTGTTLATDMTITTGGVAEAATATRDILQRGIDTIKLKVGAGDPQLDIDRILAIREVAPTAPLILDGNTGYDADGALHLLRDLRGHGIIPALFEQPLPRNDLAGMRRVTEEGGVDVAADESAITVADVQRVIAERAASVVNIKLMKCGLVGGLEIAALCRAAGVGLMIGGMLESIMAMTVSACFAAGQGGFRFVDLDTPMFLAENPFTGGFVQTGATLDVGGIVAGHGVDPR